MAKGKQLPDGTKVWDSGRQLGPNGEIGVRVHKGHERLGIKLHKFATSLNNVESIMKAIDPLIIN